MKNLRLSARVGRGDARALTMVDLLDVDIDLVVQLRIRTLSILL